MRTRTSIAGNRGFTLLELLVVLFIVGIVASVSAVAISRLHEKTLFNAETRRVVQTLKQARNSAILERKNIEFRIHEEGTSYWLQTGNEKDAKLHSLPGDMRVEGEPVIFFFPKGNSSGGTIVIKSGKGQEFQIEVDRVQGAASLRRV